jgi:2-polyprenyl-3-methyl-5-hydroxy-6-metoxy-1,4-benzoquinol methylase
METTLMVSEKGKRIDTTYLDVEHAASRGLLHRDYIAHTMRWTHIVKRCLVHNRKGVALSILDVGCGKRLPLAKMLYSNRIKMDSYVGIDISKANKWKPQDELVWNSFPLTIFMGTDFTQAVNKECDNTFTVTPGDKDWVWDLTEPKRTNFRTPDIITCFEVIEHVEADKMIDILKNILLLAEPETNIFISTPCFDQKTVAANHVNEITYEALGWIIEKLGFKIVARYGTFASQKPILEAIEKLTQPFKSVYRGLYNELNMYYDSNYLSCIFAPMFPEASRNVIWELKKRAVGERLADDQQFIDKPEVLGSGEPNEWIKALAKIGASALGN